MGSPAARGQPGFPDVPGYEVRRELGRGGTAVVFEALHLRLNRPVALKMIHGRGLPSPRRLVRFCSRGGGLARLRHPNIVQVYDVGYHDRRPYIALELVEGGDLAGAPGRPAAAAPPGGRAGRDVGPGRAIRATTRASLHRDLKPANVLLDRVNRAAPGEAGRIDRAVSVDRCVPKVTDFGLANHAGDDSGLTRTGRRHGHAPLHGPGAGPRRGRQPRRPGGGRLRPGGDPVRDADRPARPSWRPRRAR